MRRCYADVLGDCQGQIEDEHFIPRSLQNILGRVTVSGYEWQNGTSKELNPGSYGHRRMLCQKHHDDLDGLDRNALAYFRNLMLIAGGAAAHDIPGRADDVTPAVNGRNLERWFLKTICGALNAEAIDVPLSWIQALFARLSWPDEWAFYVSVGRHVSERPVCFEFYWTGVIVHAFSVETLFSIVPPDNMTALYRRPPRLVATVLRPDGSNPLHGITSEDPIQFRFDWPI